MKSIERQLQRYLALSLLLVMAGIWVVGSQLPRPAYSRATRMAEQLCQITPSVTAPTTQTTPLSNPVQPLQPPPRRFQWLFPVLALLGAVLILAIQSFVIRMAFRRFDALQQELHQLELGQIQRLNENTAPTEIYSLIKALNQVLNRMQERLERSRNAVGNLAHALKSPINLMQQSLTQTDFSAQHHLLSQQTERLRQLTERELKRARLAGLGHHHQRFNPQQELPVLVQVLRQSYPQRDLTIQLRLDAATPHFGDREDMLELIGNLLDNACKWAKQQVRCTLSKGRDAATIYIMIEDDGVGCSEADLHLMTARGMRLDESVAGHGLGLAICKDIVKLYGGQINFTLDGDLGGLTVHVILPLA